MSETRCPECGGEMRLDVDPNDPLGDLLICNVCQRVVGRF